MSFWVLRYSRDVHSTTDLGEACSATGRTKEEEKVKVTMKTFAFVLVDLVRYLSHTKVTAPQVTIHNPQKQKIARFKTIISLWMMDENTSHNQLI